MHDADALAVQAQVLREALRDHELEAAAHELAHRPPVLLDPFAEALVRDVEEGQVAARRQRVGDLQPLVARQVEAGGVVADALQHEDGAARGGADGGEQAREVDGVGGAVIVLVLRDGDAGVREDVLVVVPRGRADVGGRGAVVGRGEELGGEDGAGVAGAAAGDGLGAGDLVGVLKQRTKKLRDRRRKRKKQREEAE